MSKPKKTITVTVNASKQSKPQTIILVESKNGQQITHKVKTTVATALVAATTNTNTN